MRLRTSRATRRRACSRTGQARTLPQFVSLFGQDEFQSGDDRTRSEADGVYEPGPAGGGTIPNAYCLMTSIKVILRLFLACPPQMQRMAASMDPSQLAAMGMDPSAARQAQQQFAKLSPEEMARAREQARRNSN